MLLIAVVIVVAFNGSAVLAERSLASWAGRPAPGLSPAILVGWFWIVPRARGLRQLVPPATRPRSALRLVFGILAVGTVTRVVAALFVRQVKKLKTRASHARGFAMAGRATVTWDEAFAPAFLRPGRDLRVILRHATNFRHDDAALDGRGVGIRLTSEQGESLSLLCNSSPGAPFWDTRSMFKFFAALGRNEAAVRKWIEGSPRAAAAWTAGITRAPKSLAELAYWSQQPLLLHGADGVQRAVRFRVRGADVTDPLGANQLSEDDTRRPWIHERRPDTTLPPDYLREEYRHRLAGGPVGYILEAQFLELDSIVERKTLAGDLPWNETEIPWKQVAIITVDRMLDPAEEDQLRLYPGQTPDGMELFRPAGPADPNAILWYRSRMYAPAQHARRPFDRTPAASQLEPERM